MARVGYTSGSLAGEKVEPGLAVGNKKRKIATGYTEIEIGRHEDGKRD